jgi:hypothetical protein
LEGICGQPARSGPPAWVLVAGANDFSSLKEAVYYEILLRVCDLEGSFGTTQAKENGHEI